MLNAVIVQREGPFPYFIRWEVSVLLPLPSCGDVAHRHPLLIPLAPILGARARIDSPKQEEEADFCGRGCTRPTSLTHSGSLPEWRLWCQSHGGGHRTATR